MRKIAANYIYLPGYRLIKNGYVVIEGENKIHVVDTNGIIKEFHGLEFYGGMIIDGRIQNKDIEGLENQPIIPFLDHIYSRLNPQTSTLSIIQHADLSQLTFLKETTIKPLIR